MFLKNIFLITTLIVINCNTQEVNNKKGWGIVGNPLAHYHPCNGNDAVSIAFESGRAPGEENQYNLFVREKLPMNTRARLMFDSEATVTLADPDKARVQAIGQIFLISFFKKSDSLSVRVQGPATGTIPYVKSIKINSVEYCADPKTGYLDSLIQGAQPSASVSLTTPDDTCGRRKVEHTELIVSGQPTKPGDWPWHVALHRLDGATLKYICGGTLISKTVVLTAAHCVTSRGAPLLSETLNVVLGKYNLIGGDTSTQEREVHEILVHEEFDFRMLNNDIAVLKLKSEAVFNDYVQPACLWSSNNSKRLPSGQLFGTVVGWGFDQNDSLSSQLRQAKMPKVSESACLKSNPVFFGRLLNNQKFCAGYANGTSVCNGDSGGGFTVFVPDVSQNTAPNASGTWHVRGIVSTSVSRSDAAICDPTQYVLFTDVQRFKKWIERAMK